MLTFYEASTSYLKMLTDMRAALQARLPDLTWQKPAPYQDGEAGCKEPYENLPETITAVFDAGGGRSRGVPDSVWLALVKT